MFALEPIPQYLHLGPIGLFQQLHHLAIGELPVERAVVY